MILKKSLLMFIIPFVIVIIGFTNSELSPAAFSSLSFFYNPKPFNGNARISGGHVSKPHQFPYYISIIENKLWYCGGVLIQSLWALTTKKCVENNNLRVVVAGYVNRLYPLETPGAVEVEIEKYFRYESEGDHNIALLKLKKPINESKTIKYAHLPKPNVAFIGQTGYVMGHGWEQQGGPQLDFLKYTIGTVDKQCGNYLCVKPVENGSLTCEGDNGSPMVLNKPKKKKCYTVIGLSHAHGTDCGDPKTFAYFSNVTIYLDWIKKTMESN